MIWIWMICRERIPGDNVQSNFFVQIFEIINGNLVTNFWNKVMNFWKKRNMVFRNEGGDKSRVFPKIHPDLGPESSLRSIDDSLNPTTDQMLELVLLMKPDGSEVITERVSYPHRWL